MKIFFLLFFFIPNLALSLTFKDGKQVDEKSQINDNFEKKSRIWVPPGPSESHQKFEKMLTF